MLTGDQVGIIIPALFTHTGGKSWYDKKLPATLITSVADIVLFILHAWKTVGL